MDQHQDLHGVKRVLGPKESIVNIYFLPPANEVAGR